MPINEYENSFSHLVEKDLPSYLEEIQRDIVKQRAMSLFSEKGKGVITTCKELGLKSDFSGCYLLLENEKPVYVGISRKVIARLRQHVCGNTHYDASLAYRIAAKDFDHKKTRSEAMKDVIFKAAFLKARSYIESLTVAFVEIENPLALYVFEPYCAMYFNTDKWNSFRTH